MTQKNKDADLTNPNLYSIIDEHVYDEIKHKEGYRDPGKSFSLSLNHCYMSSIIDFSILQMNTII